MWVGFLLPTYLYSETSVRIWTFWFSYLSRMVHIFYMFFWLRLSNFLMNSFSFFFFSLFQIFLLIVFMCITLLIASLICLTLPGKSLIVKQIKSNSACCCAQQRQMFWNHCLKLKGENMENYVSFLMIHHQIIIIWNLNGRDNTSI